MWRRRVRVKGVPPTTIKSKINNFFAHPDDPILNDKIIRFYDTISKDYNHNESVSKKNVSNDSLIGIIIENQNSIYNISNINNKNITLYNNNYENSNSHC